MNVVIWCNHRPFLAPVDTWIATRSRAGQTDLAGRHPRPSQLQPVLFEQVQPHFADSGERWHRVPQHLKWDGPGDGDSRRVQQLLYARSGEGCAHNHAAGFIDD